jgi:predicted acyl esterase
VRFSWIVCIGLLVAQVPFAAAQEGATPVYEIELREAWIPMPDGVRLAADLYLPSPPEPGGPDGRFPVLLEYLPYRKTDSRASRYPLFSYFVERGYVVARVDIRGTGGSEGRLVDYEYTDQEQEDGEVVIDWLSRQPFSNGKVGMFGISWGAFNSIQMAMRNPPALKAILAIEGTDDLYQDDCHFIDGVMHVDSYEIEQDVDNMLPGAPDFVIDDDYFRDRFDTTPWVLVYKRQQRDGPFWDRASLNERYDSIRIPTFVIGGWYDGYRDSVPRMLQHLSAPVKGLVKGMIGPWAHAWPNDAYPEPTMEWRHEAVRWFDRWLRDRETGIMDEPRFAVYVRRWHPPGVDLTEAPGDWRFEDGWPLERGRHRILNLQPDHTLSLRVPTQSAHTLDYQPSIGIEAGGSVMWWGDFAPDQAPTDAKSLVYDTEPLDEDLEILGFPRVLLNASASAPLADWFVRLSDVAPDGRITLITGAGSNGAHRNSATDPEALRPGETYPLEIEMHFTSWIFPKGHRVRLSIGNAQWPMFWPTPFPMTTTLSLGGSPASHLVLPVVPHEDRPTPSFLRPSKDPELPGYAELQSETVSGYAELHGAQRDEQGKPTVVLENRSAARYPWGIHEVHERITHQTDDEDPANSSVVGDYAITVRLAARTLRVQGVLDFRSDRESFHLVYTRRFMQDGEIVRERTWRETFPRDFQ